MKKFILFIFIYISCFAQSIKLDHWIYGITSDGDTIAVSLPITFNDEAVFQDTVHINMESEALKLNLTDIVLSDSLTIVDASGADSLNILMESDSAKIHSENPIQFNNDVHILGTITGKDLVVPDGVDSTDIANHSIEENDLNLTTIVSLDSTNIANHSVSEDDIDLTSVISLDSTNISNHSISEDDLDLTTLSIDSTNIDNHSISEDDLDLSTVISLDSTNVANHGISEDDIDLSTVSIDSTNLDNHSIEENDLDLSTVISLDSTNIANHSVEENDIDLSTVISLDSTNVTNHSIEENDIDLSTVSLDSTNIDNHSVEENDIDLTTVISLDSTNVANHGIEENDIDLTTVSLDSTNIDDHSISEDDLDFTTVISLDSTNIANHSIEENDLDLSTVISLDSTNITNHGVEENDLDITVTGTGDYVKATSPTMVTSIQAASGFGVDISGPGNSYFEIIQDNNAGYLAVGRTTATEPSMVSITDGGADNEQGILQIYSDNGVPLYWWSSTANEFRVRASAPTDDDADGYVIIDIDDGLIGDTAQNIEFNDATLENGTTITTPHADTTKITETVVNINGKLSIGTNPIMAETEVDTTHVGRWIKVTFSLVGGGTITGWMATDTTMVVN